MRESEFVLTLEDGTAFPGKPIGQWKKATGEVVFNTSMCGYQEILTDPSYASQLIVLTYPLIGNYGTNPTVTESAGIYASGLIVSECCTKPSHWQSNSTLHDYLHAHGIPGLAGVDTRSLTRHLRQHGTMKGVLSDAQQIDQNDGYCGKAYSSSNEAYSVLSEGKWKVAVLDYGVKTNIIRSLTALGADVYVFPASAQTQDVLSVSPDAVVLSNGPGDPLSYTDSMMTIREIIKNKPTMGICLGHQLLGLALGAKTYKLKYGHRGGNHPVKDLRSGRVAITAQNHGYAVATPSSGNVLVTHLNLNDGSVEGLAHRHLPVFSVQFHPESSPGPNDSNYLFANLMGMALEKKHA